MNAASRFSVVVAFAAAGALVPLLASAADAPDATPVTGTVKGNQARPAQP